MKNLFSNSYDRVNIIAAFLGSRIPENFFADGFLKPGQPDKVSPHGFDMGALSVLKKFKLIPDAGLVSAALIIVFQKTEAVETNILFFTLIVPRAAKLAATLLIRVFVGRLLAPALGENNGSYN